MENNNAAQESLAALDADRAALADRTRMPTWYHALVGVTSAALVLLGLVPSGRWYSSLAMPIVLMVWIGLMLYPPRRSGVATSSWSIPTLLMALVFLVVLLLVVVLVNVIAVEASSWWFALPAVIAFGAGWALSVASERLVRRELTRER
jgi:hypothetical protein